MNEFFFKILVLFYLFIIIIMFFFFFFQNHQQSPLQQQPMVPLSSFTELSFRIETSEEELQDCKAEMRTLEQRLTSTEVERASLEASLKKQREILALTEERLRICEAERSELAEAERELRIQLQCLRSENSVAQRTLLAAKQEREQVIKKLKKFVFIS